MKVILVVATTVDGFIARTKDQLVNWTDIEDKDFFHSITTQLGTVIMGLNTYKTLPAPLPGRLNIVMSTNGGENIPGQLEFFSGEPLELLDSLSKRGITEAALVGGAQVDGSFFVDNLVDEIFITISPLLFGQGLNLSSGYDLETKLSLLEAKPIGTDSVLLHYQVIK